MADLSVAKARSEVQRMLLPFQALKSLEDVLAVAAKAENDFDLLQADLVKSKNVLDAIKADTELAKAEYANKSDAIKQGLQDLQAKYDELELAKKAELDAVNDQIRQVNGVLDLAKIAAQQQATQSAAAAVRTKAELEADYVAQKAMYDMQLNDARQQLEAAKAELSALIKRLGS